MDGFRTSTSAEFSMGQDESSARSLLDVVGRPSDNPAAMAALLGPGDQPWRSITTGRFVPLLPPTEASSWELAACDPCPYADVRPRETPSRASNHQHDRDDDSGAPPSEERTVEETSCPRGHLRNRLLRTLGSVLDTLTDPDEVPTQAQLFRAQ